VPFFSWYSLAIIVAVGSPKVSLAAEVSPRPIIIAHRGAHESVPENTLAAFERAIALHCDYVELDVRNTADGALVIMHDPTIDRTTNGSGRVADHSLASIRELKIRGVDKAITAHRVPTFDEALAVCQGKINVYVDHKSGKPADIVASLEKHSMLGHAAIYGPVDRLREFKKLRPSLRVIADHLEKPEDVASLAVELKPLCVAGHRLQWSREQVAAAHKVGAEVWVDVLGPTDNAIGFSFSRRIGVDGIQTNRPSECLEWRAGKTSTKATGKSPSSP
jgi:glycerophosphoryl diester phosphodiesterase